MIKRQALESKPSVMRKMASRDKKIIKINHYMAPLFEGQPQALLDGPIRPTT